MNINRKFALFMLSQGVSNFGDAFQLMAATSLLVGITGSGFSAAFGLICAPVLSILFSALAGYISDIKREKTLLVIIDLARGCIVLLFISKQNIPEIYVLIIILSTLDILYSPPKRKFVTNILKSSQLVAGNSFLNGLTGCAFIVGPIMAGIIISKYGPDIAFVINSLSFLVSAFSILIIKSDKSNVSSQKEVSAEHTIDSVFKGIEYCLNTYMLRKIIFLGTVICFATTSVNIAFYPFAFDVLKISDNIWGTMMSIFYGANLIAMSLSLIHCFNVRAFYKTVVPLSFIIVSAIWFSYANAGKLGTILLLQLGEGTILSYLSIILMSHLQMKSKKEFLGRVIGINDFINNLGKLAGIVCTYTLLKTARPSTVFMFCSLAISAYAVYSFLSIKTQRLQV